MTPEPERSSKAGKAPANWYALLLFVVPSISWFVFLGYREFVHSKTGLADGIISIVDGMESAVVFFGALAYAAVEVHEMLAEMFKQQREEKGRLERETAWATWYDRMMEAEENGEPFDEPPPRDEKLYPPRRRRGR